MLIDCPECQKSVSDRAAACPQCGYPILEWLAEKEEKVHRAEAVASRQHAGDVDCRYCAARGFVTLDQQIHGRSGFVWCPACGHTGRVAHCQAADGHYAVVPYVLDAFLEGEVHPGEPGVDFLGTQTPAGHRYPEAGKRTEYESIPNWYLELMPILRGDAGPLPAAKAVRDGDET